MKNSKVSRGKSVPVGTKHSIGKLLSRDLSAINTMARLRREKVILDLRVAEITEYLIAACHPFPGLDKVLSTGVKVRDLPVQYRDDGSMCRYHAETMTEFSIVTGEPFIPTKLKTIEDLRRWHNTVFANPSDCEF